MSLEWKQAKLPMPGREDSPGQAPNAWAAQHEDIGYMVVFDPMYPELRYSCSVRRIGSSGKPIMLAQKLHRLEDAKAVCEKFASEL